MDLSWIELHQIENGSYWTGGTKVLSNEEVFAAIQKATEQMRELTIKVKSLQEENAHLAKGSWKQLSFDSIDQTLDEIKGNGLADIANSYGY